MVAVLFNAGLQVPLIPFRELVGNGFKVVPAQNGPTLVKLGVTIGLTVMVIVVVVAHCPAVGVKVYVVVAVLLIAGLQVPLILLVDVVGKGLKVPPVQIGATWLKLGTVLLLTCMVMVVVLAHMPAVGVKV